jgi:hypothetical protein
MPRDCTKEKVAKVFGPVMNKNGHHYTKCADLEFIVKIENLWMIIHQKCRNLSLGLTTKASPQDNVTRRSV